MVMFPIKKTQVWSVIFQTAMFERQVTVSLHVASISRKAVMSGVSSSSDFGPQGPPKNFDKNWKKKHQTPGRSKMIEVKFWENYDRTWIREITNDSPGSSIIVQGIGNAWKRTNQQDYTKTASPTNHEMSFKLVRIYGMYSSLTWYHNVP